MKTQLDAKKNSNSNKSCFSMVLFTILLGQAISIANADLSITRTLTTDPPLTGPDTLPTMRSKQSPELKSETAVTSQLIKKAERLYNANLVSLNKMNDNRYLARLITHRGEVVLLQISPDGDIVKVLD